MDSDENYARCLQQQELLSLQNEDAKLAAQLQMQFEGNRNDTMMARAFQQAISEEQEATDHAVAYNLNDEDVCDGAVASAFQEQLNQESEDADGSLASSIHMAQEQDNFQAGRQASEDTADSLHHQDLNRITDEDERLAHELHSKQLAYKMQMEEDAALAASLSDDKNEDHSHPAAGHTHPRHVHTGHGVVGPFGNQVRICRNLRIMVPMPAVNIAVGPVMLDGADIPDDYETLIQLGEQLGEVQNRGLREDQLDILPVQKYAGDKPPPASDPDTGTDSADTSSDSADTQCKICLAEYIAGDDLRALPCLHRYHRDCINHWIKSKANCPVCKLDVKDAISQNVS